MLRSSVRLVFATGDSKARERDKWTAASRAEGTTCEGRYDDVELKAPPRDLAN